MNLINWDSENYKNFGDKPTIVNHNLHNDPIFTDEGLIEIIDNYPPEDLEIFTMGYNPIGWGEWFLGRRGNLDGRQLLEAVKNGRLWLNLRRSNHSTPRLQEICDTIFKEVQDKTGQKTFKHDMGLLISSPKAHVYYHADGPMVMLWQIRGIKKAFFYPPSEPCLTDPQLEAIMLRQSDEQLQFNSEFAQFEFVHDLKPGEFATWPQNSPHRIENHDCVNVSFSIEFLTAKAAWRANLAYANGYLRRVFGLNPSLEKSPKILEPFKIILARVVKLMGGYKGNPKLPVPKFSVDEKQIGKIIFDQGITAPTP
jgi:hypothetical protein